MRRHSLRDSKTSEFDVTPKKCFAGQSSAKKRKKKEPQAYPEEALLRAAEAYYLSGMSRAHAARLHHVSPYQIHKIIHNIKSVFTYGQEKELAAKILKMMSRGFEFSETDIRRFAYDFAEKKKLEHNFCSTKRMAGIDWILSFKKANPDIPVIKESSNDPSHSENPASNEIITNYCNILNDTMNQCNLINTPQLIYNVVKVVLMIKTSIKEGDKKKNVEMVTVNDASVTMLICANAAGQSIPPMAISYGKKELLKANDLPKDTLITTWDYEEPSENIFAHWLRHFRKHQNARSCLLLLDGNPWQKSFQAIHFCEKNKIQMVCVPSQDLHPLSRIVAELESNYNSNYFKEGRLASVERGQRSFGSIFSDALVKAATTVAIRDGFSGAGIYPMNLKVISENVLLPNSNCSANSPLTVCNDDEPKVEEKPVTVTLPINMNFEKSIVHEGTNHPMFPLRLNEMVSIKQEILSEMAVDVTHDIHGPIPGHTIPILGDATAVNKHQSLTTATYTQSPPINDEKHCPLRPNTLALSAPVDELKENLAETCMFCFVKFSDPVSVHLGGIIQCQGEGGELFHQRCVGTRENEEFICGRCIIGRLRARLVH